MEKKIYVTPVTEVYKSELCEPITLSVEKGGSDHGYGEPEARSTVIYYNSDDQSPRFNPWKR